MNSVAIVSTSIGHQPPAYAEWAKYGDLIIAGDKNSPAWLEQYVKDLGGRYLTVDSQREWLFCESIGWNCVQRRNCAVMQAYADHYQYVVTVDDDNTPTRGWVAGHRDHLEGKFPSGTKTVFGDRDWANIGAFVRPHVHQRGTPYGVVNAHSIFESAKPYEIVVSTAQVLGEPDCDAVSRLVGVEPVLDVIENIIVPPHTWAAFNSQATMWKGEWAPLIACLPHVGRYDDIWASFIAERIMSAYGYGFYAGTPCVSQDRNVHNIITDLQNEVYGMQVTPYLIRALRDDIQLDLTSVSLPEAYKEIAMMMNSTEGIYTTYTVPFMLKWARVWNDLLWD